MYYQLTIRTTNNGEPGEAWFVFESAIPRIERVMSALIEDGFLLGRRFETRLDGDARKVRRSFPLAINSDIVLQVTYLQDELRDASGATLSPAREVV